MKILHFSDLHGKIELLPKFREYAEKKNLDAIIFSGDLADICLKREKAANMQSALEFVKNNVKTNRSISLDEFGGLLRELQFSPNVPEKLAVAAKFYAEAEKEYDKNSEETYSDLLKEIEKFPGEILMIPGNWDSTNFHKVFEKYDIHLKEKTINDIKIAGYGGAGLSPFLIPQTRIIPYSETDLYEFLSSADPFIAVTHIPPYTNKIGAEKEGGIGSFANLAYIHNKKPAILLCGHYHELIETNEDTDTSIVHAGNFGKYNDDDKYGNFVEISIDDKGFDIEHKNINDL